MLKGIWSYNTLVSAFRHLENLKINGSIRQINKYAAPCSAF
jgi:hypothetical protein